MTKPVIIDEVTTLGPAQYAYLSGKTKPMSELVQDFIRHDVAPDTPLAPGDLMVPTAKELAKVRTLFPRVQLSTQFRITAVIKGAYSRQCLMVTDRPGVEPIGLWRSMLKRLPRDAKVADCWAKASIAEYIP